MVLGDDDWTSLPPAVQSQLHDTIAAGVRDGSVSADWGSQDPLGAAGALRGYNTGAARRAGMSDPQIARDMAGPAGGVAATAPPDPTTPPDTSMWGALRYGAHNAAAGLGETLKELGAVGIGQTVEDSIAAPQGYQPASVGFSHAHGLDALGYVPRWMVERAPDVAGATAAGMAGTALGGPIGTAAGVVGYGEARHLGENLEATRVQNGGADPGFGGNVGAALLSGGEGALEGLAPAGVLKLARLGAMAGRALYSTAQAVPIVPAAGYLAYRAMNPDDDDDGPQSKAARRSLIRRTLDWWAARGGE